VAVTIFALHASAFYPLKCICHV